MNRKKGTNRAGRRQVPVLWKKEDLSVVDEAVEKIKKTTNPYIDRAKFIREASIEKAAKTGVALPA